MSGILNRGSQRHESKKDKLIEKEIDKDLDEELHKYDKTKSINEYPNMSKNFNPYDPERQNAHYEVYELLRRDEGVSVDEILRVAPRSRSEANARMYITNIRNAGKKSTIEIQLINGRYKIVNKP